MEVLARKTAPKILSRDGERGLVDLRFFCEFFWGLDLKEQPHALMCETLQENDEDNGRPRVMLTVPRGTYKTSIARANMARKLLRQVFLYDNPYHRILIASATLKLSEITMNQIGNGLRYFKALNEEYGPLWTNRSNAGEGSKTEFGINIAQRIAAGPRAAVSEPSLWVASLASASTGLHADEGFFDDINDRKNTATAVQRQKVQEFYELCYALIGTEDGSPAKITMTNTPWHDADVRGNIVREEKLATELNPDYVSSWRILHRSAINEDGTAFFPQKYPLETLEKMRTDGTMSARVFSANYLCDPVGESGFVHEDSIVFRSRANFPALRDGRITVDPSHHKDGKEAGCFSAIIIAAYDKFANMWVQDARGSREWTTLQLIEQLFDLQEIYPYPIFMEDSHMGHFLHAVSMEEARRSEEQKKRVHLRINYVPVDVKTSKYERWERLQPRFARRGCFFAEEIEAKIRAEIKEELVRGQASRFNDFLDALAGAETGVRPKLNKDGSAREIEQPIQRGDNVVQMPRITFNDVFDKMKKLKR